ncbi:MAG: MaoC family dehydratase N-terminal domain-containing protein [Rhodoferax sp.]|nr:MaoC family dehydratase N-terminal domain-containing protein [Rhodoferax sp.]
MQLQDWIGRSEQSSDVATATPYAALSATLNRAGERPATGMVLPPLWHWLYFLPLHPQSDIGPDGHARLGGFLPPVPLPRRMWAAGQFTFHRPLRIGDAMTRTSTIDAVTEKSGRSGPLVFVKVRHEIHGAGEHEPVLTEFHDIVYRGPARPGDVTPPPVAAPAHATWEKHWVPDEVMLFRYSALTFNGHRIHYDRSYATGVEAYPGLVVHGPMVATLLLDLLRQHLPEADLESFAFRAVRPLFDTHPFHVCVSAQADGKHFELWAKDHEGWLSMDATAQIR